MVADETILEDGPVTYLLSLEHQLTDPAEDWVWDENDACWRSRNPEQRLRMEKGLKSLVLIAPTQHQLGQAQAVPDEHRTGVWEITKFSGGVSRERKTRLMENAEALLAGLRQARERTNHEAPRRSASAPPLSSTFLLGRWTAQGPGRLTPRVASRAAEPPGSCPRHGEAGRSAGRPASPLSSLDQPVMFPGGRVGVVPLGHGAVSGVVREHPVAAGRRCPSRWCPGTAA